MKHREDKREVFGQRLIGFNINWQPFEEKNQEFASYRTEKVF